MKKPGIFKDGECHIKVSIDSGIWHLSISCDNRLPTYEELKNARYKYLPDNIYIAQIFSPSKEFANDHPNTLHLWEINW